MPDIRSFNGHTPRIADDAWIDDGAVVIGDVVIGAQSSIWPMTVVRGDIHRIRIGARSNIQDASVLHVTHAGDFNPDGFPLTVGDDVTVGHKVMLHGCEIRHHCLIGMGAIIMDGAVVEPYSIVAAGSLVPGGKVLEGGNLWCGSPAKKVRAITDKEAAYFEYVAGNYVRLAAQYKNL